MNIKFLSLASGSSGNCYYLSNGNTSILIDGGLGIRTVKKIFKENIIFPYMQHLKYMKGLKGVTV